MISNADMQTICRLIELDEGRKNMAYNDADGVPVVLLTGNLTIGVGRNLSAGGLSSDEIDLMLRNDVNACIASLSFYYFFDALSTARKYALINMMFNLGYPRFKQFKNMIAALYDRDYDKAADELLDSDAARQLQARYQRLANIMRSGEFIDA